MALHDQDKTLSTSMAGRHGVVRRCASTTVAMVLAAVAAAPALARVAATVAAPPVTAAYRVVQQDAVTLQQAVEIATSQVPGRVVKAETVNHDGRRMHEVLIIQDDGLVRTVRIDPETGDIL